MATRGSKYLMASVAAALLATTTSCIYDDIRPCDTGKVEFTIINDWSDAPDAWPEGMAYLFFRRGVDSPWRFDFPTREAGKVALEPGVYDLVMYNDDTSDILFETGDHGMPFVTTETSRETLDGEDLDLQEAPDTLWGAYMGKITVSPDGVEYARKPREAQPGVDRYRLVTHPRQITPMYTVRVRHVDNLQGVVSMRGIISGMSAGVELCDMLESKHRADISFRPLVTPDSSVMAWFNTFGLPDSRDHDNELRIYFLLSDLRLLRRVFDVSDVVVSAPDPMHVLIEIDSISLPYAPPAGHEGAFDPSVAGWTTVVVNYGR